MALAGPRWLRVAQREHYVVDAVSRFALRWWISMPVNLAGLAVAIAGLVFSSRWPASAFATAAVVAVGPIGLSWRGTTSPLAWTRRLRTLALVWVGLEAGSVVGGTLAGQGPVAAAAATLALPALVDLACAFTAPVERRLAGAYVKSAAARLRRVAPKVVAITGSFGKTSTKGYVAHLAGGARSVVASPASFNNRAGLARAVNEHLAEGTEVFVAEMGTYGRGEIAELCAWICPDVAVITAVGPVHLERFGSEERVLAAKAEIVQDAPCAVLVVDDERVAALAETCARSGKRVWCVSARDTGADVCVIEEEGRLAVHVRGEEVAHGVTSQARPGNVGRRRGGGTGARCSRRRGGAETAHAAGGAASPRAVARPERCGRARRHLQRQPRGRARRSGDTAATGNGRPAARGGHARDGGARACAGQGERQLRCRSAVGGHRPGRRGAHQPPRPAPRSRAAPQGERARPES